jgi:hypothetical protein
MVCNVRANSSKWPAEDNDLSLSFCERTPRRQLAGTAVRSVVPSFPGAAPLIQINNRESAREAFKPCPLELRTYRKGSEMSLVIASQSIGFFSHQRKK